MKQINIKHVHFFFWLVSALSFSACSFNTPDEYFNRTTLNTNVFSGFVTGDFVELSQRKIGDLSVFEENKTIPSKNYRDYIQRNRLVYVDKYLQDVKSLKVTEETKPMIEASLDVFDFGKSVYQTDYVKIAEMMDRRMPQDSIKAAIDELEKTKGTILRDKIKKLIGIALPYAREHGIEVNLNKDNHSNMISR